MDPWNEYLVVVRRGSHDAAERRSLSRDVEQRRYRRLRHGVYLPSAGQLEPEQLHILQMRALAAASDRRPVFSHWSAMLAHGLAPYRHRLARVHVTVGPEAFRGRTGVAAHPFALTPAEIVETHGLLVTAAPRMVPDVAAASPAGEALATADAVLCAGLPRWMLESAVDLQAPRRGAARVQDVVALAHPGSESAAESETRSTLFRYGIEPPVLQHPIWDADGLVGYLDGWDPVVRSGWEVDGRGKYLASALSVDETKRALYAEKRREDRLRVQLRGLGRWGWEEARSIALLQPILSRIGIRPASARPTVRDWAIVAAAARPRRRGRFSAYG